MRRPPAHSHASSGSITTPMATEPAGRFAMGCTPETLPCPPTWSKVRYTSPRNPESMAGVPTAASALPNVVVAGANTPPPSTLTRA